MIGCPQPVKRCRRILRLALNVVACAQLAGSWLFVFFKGDSHRVEAHSGGELDAEVSESTPPEDLH